MKKCDLPLMTKSYYFIRALFKYSKEAKVNLFSFAAYNLFQIPVFFLMVFSIRKISYEQDLTNTGILWFKNLNEPDPYMILPLCSVLLMYFNIGRGIDKNNEHWLINKWRSYFQVIQFIMLPFSCLWPSVNINYKFYRELMCIGYLHSYLLLYSQWLLDTLKF
jgi:membrane protein insertase Oxa1/YidC/SpoIIIJ